MATVAEEKDEDDAAIGLLFPRTARVVPSFSFDISCSKMDAELEDNTERSELQIEKKKLDQRDQRQCSHRKRKGREKNRRGKKRKGKANERGRRQRTDRADVQIEQTYSAKTKKRVEKRELRRECV